jgi:hypothetical protein
MAKKSKGRSSLTKGNMVFGTVSSQEAEQSSALFRIERFLPPILLLGCAAGALFTFLSAYSIQFYAAPLWGTLFLCGAGFGILYQIPRLKWFLLPSAVILLTAFCYVCRKELLKGVKSFGYQCFQFLKDSGYTAENPFFHSSDLLQCTLLLCVFAVLFTALIGFFLSAFPSFPIVLLFTLPLGALVFWYRFEPAFWSVFLYFISMAGFGVSRGYYRKSIARKQKKQVSRPFQGSSPAVVTVCLLLALSIGLVQAFWSLFSLERPKNFDRYAQQIREFDYALFFNNLLFNPFPIGRDEGNLPRGNLVYDYRTDLVVTMPYPSQNVYLRGFSGAGYQNGRWIEIPDEEYQNSLWYQQLQETGFSYFDLEARNRSYGELLLMEIKSVDGGTKYAYTPEGVMEGSDLRAQYDRSFRPKGSRYVIPYVTQSHRDEIPNAETLEWSLSPQEYAVIEEYGNFVNSYYTGHYLDGLEDIIAQIQDNTQKAVEAEQREYEESVREWNETHEDKIPLQDFIYDENSLILDLAEQVKLYLKENCQYTRSPGETPEGKDPVSYFLLENKRGYCVHFASAATLLLQSMGIPSRYVEGYLIRTENLIDAKTEPGTLQTSFSQIDSYSLQTSQRDYTLAADYMTAKLNDSSAHAWVEYYIDGYWYILEVTPGYAEDEFVELEFPEESSQAEVSQSQSESSQEISPQEESFEESIQSEVSEAQNANRASIPVSVMLWALTPVLLLLLIIMRKEVLEKRRLARFSSPNRREAVLAEYRYLSAFLKYSGCRESSDICYHPEKLQKVCPDFTLDYGKQCMEIALKAAFSKAELSEEEYQIFSSFVQGFVKKQKERMPKWKKVIVTYLLGL